ncbi:MAG: hypothetical protein IAE67_02640 [Candidatus Competibacteraceae bacterium]|nr:hypothetical protein [Candidatus Competibacteraceae bacterium]
MDWFFVPLGKFFVWSFQFIEMAGMKFNIAMIGIGSLLLLYWISQMLSHKNDKGLFKK